MNVTEQDRERAAEALGVRYGDNIPRTSSTLVAARIEAVAAALADERDRARAPFLAWAAELEGVVEVLRRAADTASKDYDRTRYTEMADEGRATIDRIRRAAEDPQ